MAPQLSMRERELLRDRVRDFALVYDKVTASMRDQWSLRRRLPTDGKRDARWLAFLMANFYALYKRWENEADLANYIRMFLQRRSRLFRLSGFVYLHISHDLPLVIAKGLLPLGKNNPPGLSRNRARQLYVGLTPYFAESFFIAVRRGALGPGIRIQSYIPGARHYFGVLSQWALTLRSIAWIHGEMLRDLGGSETVHRRLLRRAIEDAAARAARRFWLFGLPIEPPQVELLAVSMLVITSTWLIIGLLVFILVAYSLYLRYEASAINYLGRCLAEELLNNISRYQVNKE